MNKILICIILCLTPVASLADPGTIITVNWKEVENSCLRWDTVPGAQFYKVQIVKRSITGPETSYWKKTLATNTAFVKIRNVIVPSYRTEKTFKSHPGDLKKTEQGMYDVKVVAVNGEFESQMSDPIFFKIISSKIGHPENLRIVD